MSKHLTPLEVCEALFGHIESVSVAAGLEGKAAYAWRHASKWRDAGDIGASRYQRRLLAHAAARGIPLTADHLIWGAPASQIEALLAANSERMAAE